MRPLAGHLCTATDVPILEQLVMGSRVGRRRPRITVKTSRRRSMPAETTGFHYYFCRRHHFVGPVLGVAKLLYINICIYLASCGWRLDWTTCVPTLVQTTEIGRFGSRVERFKPAFKSRLSLENIDRPLLASPGKHSVRTVPKTLWNIKTR